MSILTGLFPASGGKARVNEKNTETEMDAIRESLGLCPQHNVLFDRLTVKEHLEFFSALKVSVWTNEYFVFMEIFKNVVAIIAMRFYEEGFFNVSVAVLFFVLNIGMNEFIYFSCSKNKIGWRLFIP